MLGIVAVPSVLFFFLLIPIPESPRWLVKQHRRDEALAVLERVGNENPRQRRDEIVESLDEERVAAGEPFLQAKYRVPILLAIAIAAFNQLSGINALMYYAPYIFKMAGRRRRGLAAIGRRGRHEPRVHPDGHEHHRSFRPAKADAGRAPSATSSAWARRPGPSSATAPSSPPRRQCGGAGQPAGVYRLPRLWAGRGDLGVHQRDLSQPRPRPRTGAGQLHPLDHGRRDHLDLPLDRRMVGRIHLRLLLPDDGVAIGMGAGGHAGDQGRAAGTNPAELGIE